MATLTLFPEPQKWQFLRMRMTNLAKTLLTDSHKSSIKEKKNNFDFVGGCVMGLVIKAQND